MTQKFEYKCFVFKWGPKKWILFECISDLVSLLLTIKMTGGGNGGKIKLFRFIQTTYQTVGIIPPQPNSINTKKWYFLLGLVQFFISTVAYLLFEANSIIEYGMVFYTCTTALFSFVVYLVLHWQMKNTLNFIESCDRFIEKSEYFPSILIERQIIWRCHPIQFEFEKCTSFGVIYLLFLSYNIYFFLNLCAVGMHSTMVYRNTNEKIERFTEFYGYVMIVANIIYTLIPLLYTTVNYYVLDSGKESFFLFSPTWFVFD